MSSPILLGTYVPGRTLLHRAPVGAKLAGLAAFSVTVVASRDTTASLVLLGVALALAALARVRLRALLRALRAMLVMAVAFAAFQWWLSGADKAVETFVDLLALVLAAVVVSTTTSVNAMLDAIVGGLSGLRRVGVDPDRVALAFTLAVQALPGTLALALETRDAARARGLSRHPRAYLTPFVIRVVARAEETGDALRARGLD